MLESFVHITIILLILFYFFFGFSIGSERFGWILVSGGILISAVILFLVYIAVDNPEISFALSSSEWAIVILSCIGFYFVPFVIGYIIGRKFFYVR